MGQKRTIKMCKFRFQIFPLSPPLYPPLSLRELRRLQRLYFRQHLWVLLAHSYFFPGYLRHIQAHLEQIVKAVSSSTPSVCNFIPCYLTVSSWERVVRLSSGKSQFLVQDASEHLFSPPTQTCRENPGPRTESVKCGKRAVLLKGRGNCCLFSTLKPLISSLGDREMTQLAEA